MVLIVGHSFKYCSHHIVTITWSQDTIITCIDKVTDDCWTVAMKKFYINKHSIHVYGLITNKPWCCHNIMHEYQKYLTRGWWEYIGGLFYANAPNEWHPSEHEIYLTVQYACLHVCTCLIMIRIWKPYKGLYLESDSDLRRVSTFNANWTWTAGLCHVVDKVKWSLPTPYMWRLMFFSWAAAVIGIVDIAIYSYT